MTQDTSTKHIELNVFLRVVVKAAGTGGKAKLLIREGKVQVNGQVEMQNRKKLRAGDVVEFEGKKFEVKDEVLR